VDATEWFEPRASGVGIVRITEPHVDEILRSNLWWLRGTDRDIVIDAGLGVVPLRQGVPSMFDRDPLVLLTHAHLDHVGGAHEFTERGAHTADVDVLARGVPASLHGPELAQLLGAADVGSPFPDLMIKELPHPGYDPRAYRLQPVTVTRRLQDRERIELGGRTLSVLHLPGHTPGSIALLEEITGVLYAGDVIYDGYLVDDLPESDTSAYRCSMAVLADLKVSIVHPGHGRSFDQTRLRELAARYLDRA